MKLKSRYTATMVQTYDNEAMSPPRVPPRQQVTQKFPVVGEREPVPEALDVCQWRLRITGEVQQPQTWTYDELLRLPQVLLRVVVTGRVVAGGLPVIGGNVKHDIAS